MCHSVASVGRATTELHASRGPSSIKMRCCWLIKTATATLALASGAARACDRAAILQTVDEFMLAQTAGQPGAVHNLGSSFVYQENNRTGDIKTGILSQALHLDHNHTIVDLTACASYTELISIDAAKPYVTGTQIQHLSDDGMRIATIDAIVSTTGSWLFNASQTLHYVLLEKWDVIEPAEKRDTRQTLRAAADAYLDMWSNKSAIAAVPVSNLTCPPAFLSFFLFLFGSPTGPSGARRATGSRAPCRRAKARPTTLASRAFQVTTPSRPTRTAATSSMKARGQSVCSASLSTSRTLQTATSSASKTENCGTCIL
jgi:hypothetical protein